VSARLRLTPEALPSGRVTGLQAATLGTSVLLEAWRQQFGTREYAALVDLLWRVLSAERDRLAGTRWELAA
jgi:hypothetical protein